MKIKIVFIFLLLIVSSSFVSAENNLANLRSTLSVLAGHWKGVDTYIEPQTGKETPNEAEITFVITGGNGLDFSYWNQEFMGVSVHQEKGKFSDRNWLTNGPMIQYTNNIMAHPLNNTAWKLTETFIRTDFDGVKRDHLIVYSIQSDSFEYIAKARRAGSDTDYAIYLRGKFTRANS